MESFLLLAGVVSAHNNQTIEGRTRLQKTLLLLQHLGLPTNYVYSMHFYGPYSEELATDVSVLEKLGLLEQASEPRGAYTKYILSMKEKITIPLVADYQTAIDRISQSNDTPLELAATYVEFMKMCRDHNEALERLKFKKSKICSPEKLKNAMQLLSDLRLNPHPEFLSQN